MPKPKHFTWFKFDFKLWREDSQLRRCSKETRGFWIDCIALMEESDSCFIEGMPSELCRELSCTMEEFQRSIAELQRTGAATIVRCCEETNCQCPPKVKIICRHILKAVNLTEYSRLKKRAQRENSDISAENKTPKQEKQTVIQPPPKTHIKKPKSGKFGTEAREIFEYWQNMLNHPKSTFTPERKRLVIARLEQGYSADDLKKAIDGCCKSPHHMGLNDTGTVYDDLTLICRSGSKIEQFISYNTRNQNNGTHQNNHRPTAADTIESYREIIAKYPDEREQSNGPADSINAGYSH